MEPQQDTKQEFMTRGIVNGMRLLLCYSNVKYDSGRLVDFAELFTRHHYLERCTIAGECVSDEIDESVDLIIETAKDVVMSEEYGPLIYSYEPGKIFSKKIDAI